MWEAQKNGGFQVILKLVGESLVPLESFHQHQRPTYFSINVKGYVIF